MSYCRFSCDDWKSDVYAYESCYGCFTIHVAASRKEGYITPLPEYDFENNGKEYFKAHAQQMEDLKKTKQVNIGLKYDGRTFEEPDYESMIERLKEIQAAGYHVPEWVFKDA